MFDVEEFTHHYIVAMLWANAYTEVNGELVSLSDTYVEVTAEDLSDEAREAISVDCAAFCETVESEGYIIPDEYTSAQAGHDFALTRNHHGAGFWDRGLGEVGDRLTKLAHGYGESDLYVDESGTAHLES